MIPLMRKGNFEGEDGWGVERVRDVEDRRRSKTLEFSLWSKHLQGIHYTQSLVSLAHKIRVKPGMTE